jgi:hypothetical protein
MIIANIDNSALPCADASVCSDISSRQLDSPTLLQDFRPIYVLIAKAERALPRNGRFVATGMNRLPRVKKSMERHTIIPRTAAILSSNSHGNQEAHMAIEIYFVTICNSKVMAVITVWRLRQLEDGVFEGSKFNEQSQNILPEHSFETTSQCLNLRVIRKLKSYRARRLQAFTEPML